MTEPDTTRALELRENAAWSTHALGIESCSRLEIVVTLYEHETASVRPDDWPQGVRAKMFRNAEEWVDTHKDRAVRAITYAIATYDGLRACVLILHHAKKGA